MQKVRDKMYMAFIGATILYAIVLHYSDVLGLGEWKMTLMLGEFVAVLLLFALVKKEAKSILAMADYVGVDEVQEKVNDHYVLKEKCKVCGDSLIVAEQHGHVRKKCTSCKHHNIVLKKRK